MTDEFWNIYSHGFARVAACVPEVRPGDPIFNGKKIFGLMREAAEQKAAVAVFPELALTGCSCGDLFYQEALREAALKSLERVLEASAPLDIAAVVGLPLRIGPGLFNCAAVIFKGRILGLSAKASPRPFPLGQSRQFSPGAVLRDQTVSLLGQKDIPVGPDLLFEPSSIPGLRFYCGWEEDLYDPDSTSGKAALAGASLFVLLGASPAAAGRGKVRGAMAKAHSARNLAAVVLANAGPGESTTDFAWDGQALVAVGGEIEAESKLFQKGGAATVADVDLGKIAGDRMRSPYFREGGRQPFRKISFDMEAPKGRIPLLKALPRSPFVPEDPGEREKLCEEVFAMAVQGLAARMEASGVKNLVIGVSGGLDSTQALLVCAGAVDLLGLPRTHIKAYALPGFATSERTAAAGRRLMEALGVEAGEIDIKPGSLRMLKDLGHPAAKGDALYDVTFENVQAGQRTALLFRLANARKAMVVGTGDMSELALGWCTFGVGDHMAHYGVNAAAPKTLLKAMVDWAGKGEKFAPASEVLKSILGTEISPELVPGRSGDEPAQSTEGAIGPYELQDFNLYHLVTQGCSPSKTAFLAHSAWGGKYSWAEIKKWLALFVERFYRTSQFKRSCLPDGPGVGEWGSLSPRGGYCAPSDGRSAPWEEDLENNTPEEGPEA